MTSEQDECEVDIGAIMSIPVLDEEGVVTAAAHRSRQHIDRSVESIKRSAVLYLSRVPDRMTVCDVHSLLSKYGDLGRIYLKPDEQRGGGGGHRPFKFSEGWIEFSDKKVAKNVAEMLNNRQVGGKSRKAPWYNDIWNMRYLPNFKWSYLKEESAQRQISKRKHLVEETKLGKKEAEYLTECLGKSKRMQRRKTATEPQTEDTQPNAKEYAIKQQEWVFEEKPMSDHVIRRIFNVKQ